MKKNLLTILCLIASVFVAKAEQEVVIFAGSKAYEGDIANKVEYAAAQDIEGVTLDLPGIGSFVIDNVKSSSAVNRINPEGQKPHLQWAKNSVMTININQGVTLDKIVMYCTTKNYTPNGMECSTGTFTYDNAETMSATWTGPATSILTLDNTPHLNAEGTKSYDVRIMYMILTYTTENGSTGVDEITVADENAPVEYYNMQGIRVNNPENGGVYIRRQGANAQKVFYCE